MLQANNWIKLSPKGKEIDGRWGHSCILHNNKMYIFGGFKRIYLNELICYDLIDNQIKLIPTNHQSGIIPKPRSNFSSVIYEKENTTYLIIHGGSGKNDVFNDTHSFDMNTYRWKELKTLGREPLNRSYHSANLIYDNMILFGGECNNEIFNDIWILNLNSLIWSEIKTRLNPRSFHCSEVIDRNIYIYGGCYLNYTPVSDMVILEFEKNENVLELKDLCVLKFKYDELYPSPRWGALMKNLNGNLIFFSGREIFDNNDLWIFYTSSKSWKKIYVVDQLTLPPVRRRTNGILYNQNLIIFGGYNKEEFLADFYMINLNPNFIVMKHDCSTDFYKFINNKDMHDFMISNNKTYFYAHKKLFFLRISCTDIAKSNSLSQIYRNFSNVLDLSEFNYDNCVIYGMIEFLYLGKFFMNISINHLIHLIKIIHNLNLLELRNKLLDYIKLIYFEDYPKEYILSRYDLEKYKNYYFNNLFDSEIIKPLNIQDKLINDLLNYKKPISNINESILYFRNKVLFYYKDSFKNLSDMTSRDIINKTLLYNLDKLDFTNMSINELIDLLYFSDYLCFDSLSLKVEQLLINFIDPKNILILILISIKCHKNLLIFKLLEIIHLYFPNCIDKINTFLKNNSQNIGKDFNDIKTKFENENKDYIRILNFLPKFFLNAIDFIEDSNSLPNYLNHKTDYGIIEICNDELDSILTPTISQRLKFSEKQEISFKTNLSNI